MKRRGFMGSLLAAVAVKPLAAEAATSEAVWNSTTAITVELAPHPYAATATLIDEISKTLQQIGVWNGADEEGGETISFYDYGRSIGDGIPESDDDDDDGDPYYEDW